MRALEYLAALLTLAAASWAIALGAVYIAAYLAARA